MNILSVDLNLLKAFAALHAERHVTRAGARIGLAQPSMSNALSRLRALFEDELFQRTPSGMVPTLRALELAPQIQAALTLLDQALQPVRAFDPGTSEGSITLSTGDHLMLVLAPEMLARFRKVAPGLDIRLRDLGKTTIWAELDRGEIDAAIGTFETVPARFHSRRFLTDEFVCIARRGHPELSQGLTIQEFVALPHVLMTLGRDATGAVDKALRIRGLSRRVVMTVTQFSVVAHLVGRSDCIATIPRTVAQIAGRNGECEVFAPPLSLPSWSMDLVWSSASQARPMTKFAIEQLSLLGELSDDKGASLT
jgi:DNA-binding transcriptional LysR family regulator